MLWLLRIKHDQHQPVVCVGTNGGAASNCNGDSCCLLISKLRVVAKELRFPLQSALWGNSGLVQSAALKRDSILFRNISHTYLGTVNFIPTTNYYIFKLCKIVTKVIFYMDYMNAWTGESQSGRMHKIMLFYIILPQLFIIMQRFIISM